MAGEIALKKPGETVRVTERPATEQPKAPERQFERSVEQVAAGKIEQALEGTSGQEVASPTVTPLAAPVNQTMLRREKQIEEIMSEGLEELYLSMEPAKQQEFRQQGEQVAKKVNELLSETKLKIVKIINLIKDWLSIIPGVNQYFLEQETKLKVDEIIQLKKGGD